MTNLSHPFMDGTGRRADESASSHEQVKTQSCHVRPDLLCICFLS